MTVEEAKTTAIERAYKGAAALNMIAGVLANKENPRWATALEQMHETLNGLYASLLDLSAAYEEDGRLSGKTTLH